MENTEYFKTNISKIVQTRENVKEQLRDLGFECTDSKANFLFVTHPRYDALKLFEVDHDYDASLEEISYALETVEPGVTDRFVSSYEKTREQIRM